MASRLENKVKYKENKVKNRFLFKMNQTNVMSIFPLMKSSKLIVITKEF